MNNMSVSIKNIKSGKRFFEFIILLSIVLIFSFLKFKKFFLNQGQYVVGNEGDPRYILFMMEHIYQSLSNNFFNIFSPSQFYPYKWTITFSDWVLFPGLFHSFFRFLGINLFNAFEYSIILANALFFLFFYFTLRNIAKINKFISLYTSLFITYGYFLEYYRWWLQNFSVFLVPLYFLFLFSEKIQVFYTPLNQFLNKKRYLIAGLIVALSLFSSFYFGLSLSLIALIDFTIYQTSKFNKNSTILQNIYSAVVSKRFIYTFTPSIFFIILNIPGLFIANVAGFSERNLSQAKINDYYFNPFFVTLVIGWINFFINKFVFKNYIDFKRVNLKILLVLTIPLLLFFQFIPDIFNVSNDYWISINQIIVYLTKSIIRDYTRFFYPFYLLSIIYVAILLKDAINKFHNYLKFFKLRKLNFIVCFILIISFSYLYKIDYEIPFRAYNHDINVQMHKELFEDAKKQLSNQKNCDAFYLESYDKNLQINQASAALISITSGVPTLNGISGAVPKGWLMDRSGFMDEKYKKDLNKYIVNQNLNTKNICKVELRNPPFFEMTLNEKSSLFIYKNKRVNLYFDEIENKGKYSLLKDQFGGFHVRDNKDKSNIRLIRKNNEILALQNNFKSSILASDELEGVNKLLVYNHLKSVIEIWASDKDWQLLKKLDSLEINNKNLNEINKQFKINLGINLSNDIGKSY